MTLPGKAIKGFCCFVKYLDRYKQKSDSSISGHFFLSEVKIVGNVLQILYNTGRLLFSLFVFFLPEIRI